MELSNTNTGSYRSHLEALANQPIKSNKNPLNSKIQDIIRQAKKDLESLSKSEDGIDAKQVQSILNSLKVVKNLSERGKGILNFVLVKLGLRKIDPEIKELTKIAESLLKKSMEDLGPQDVKFFQLLQQMQANLDSQIELTQEEREFYFSYINSTSDKRHLIKILDKFETNIMLNSDLKGKELRDFSEVIKAYKFIISLNVDVSRFKMGKINEKMSKLLAWQPGDAKLSQQDKLTYQEIGLFNKFSSSSESTFFKQLKDADLLDANLKQNLETYNKFLELKNKVEEKILGEVNFPTGSIGFSNIYKRNASRNHQYLSWKNRGQVLATLSKRDHAGVYFKNDEGKHAYSHVTGLHSREPLDLLELANSDFVTLDWKKVIPKNIQKQLGSDWEKIVKEKYEKICQNFHSTQSFDKLFNEEEHREQSIWRAAKNKTENNPKEWTFTDQTVFCTQFVGMTIVKTLDLLEDELRNELKITNTSQLVIHSPFDKKDNFEAMHPGRLERKIKAFAKTVKSPPLLYQFVDVHSAAKI
jgi:hypothetical protein